MSSYQDFIESKELKTIPVGFEPNDALWPADMFHHQQSVAAWACRKGRAGVFFDTGLGKTITQLAWAQQVQAKDNGYVLILTPLAVAKQTEREAVKFGMVAMFVENGDAIGDPGIYITNYEKLHRYVNFRGRGARRIQYSQGHDGQSASANYRRIWRNALSSFMHRDSKP